MDWKGHWAPRGNSAAHFLDVWQRCHRSLSQGNKTSGKELFSFLAKQLAFTKPAIDGTHLLSILEKGKEMKRGGKKIVKVEYIKKKKKEAE